MKYLHSYSVTSSEFINMYGKIMLNHDIVVRINVTNNKDRTCNEWGSLIRTWRVAVPNNCKGRRGPHNDEEVLENLKFT